MPACLPLLLLAGIANALIVLPVVANERPVAYRERASGLYSTFTYTMAQGMAELPYLVVQVSTCTACRLVRGGCPNREGC